MKKGIKRITGFLTGVVMILLFGLLVVVWINIFDDPESIDQQVDVTSTVQALNNNLPKADFVGCSLVNESQQIPRPEVDGCNESKGLAFFKQGELLCTLEVSSDGKFSIALCGGYVDTGMVGEYLIPKISTCIFRYNERWEYHCP